MRLWAVLKPLAGAALLAGVVGVGYLTRGAWVPRLFPPPPAAEEDDHDHGPARAGEPQQVRLSPQAQANLRLAAEPLKTDTFWRTVQIPATVVDRAAHSDRSVVAPVAGVVAAVHRHTGDTVRPADPLFTLRLVGDALHTTQTELYKTAQEAVAVGEQRKRVSTLAATGAVSEAKVVDLDNQLRRLAAADKAYRHELQTRGLTADQIDGAAEGRFVTEVVVAAPPHGDHGGLAAGPVAAPAEAAPFEVQELKVELGQQVPAGQTLALLADHRALVIEGRAFRQETPLVERAAREGWPVRVEFLEEAGGDWPSAEQAFTIRHVANTIDPVTRTVAFHLPLANQSRPLAADGRGRLVWRYRPGQRVRLHLRVEKIENVFVLPAEAVVREGAEAYVFRQNGDLFDRKPVRVVYQDREHAVVANDGAVPPGVFVARGGAAQLNRALKSEAGPPPGFHVHADGTVHKNH
jgi:multidrug efflux pump subunit AcrA (membrane-fusion protein)